MLSQTTDRGGSALQIIPVTLVNDNLDDAVGTPLSLSVVGEGEITYSLKGSASSDEVNEVQLIHGVTLQTPKITKKVDKAGAEIASASGGGGGTGNTLTITVYEQDYQFLVDMQSLIGDTFIIWFPLGDRNHDGFGWLLARFDGDLKVKRSGNAHNGVQLTIVGKSLALDSGATAAALITALTAAVTSISQPGIAASAPANPLNPKTNITSSNAMLVEADIDNPGLLAGTWVFHKGA